MEIQKRQPTVKAPTETFTGDAWYDVIAPKTARNPRPNGETR